MKSIYNLMILLTLLVFIILIAGCAGPENKTITVRYVDNQDNDTLFIKSSKVVKDNKIVTTETYIMQVSFKIKIKKRNIWKWKDSLYISKRGIYRYIHSPAVIIFPNYSAAHVNDYLWLPSKLFNDYQDTLTTFSDRGFKNHTDTDYIIPIEYSLFLDRMEYSNVIKDTLIVIARVRKDNEYKEFLYYDRDRTLVKYQFVDDLIDKKYTILKKDYSKLKDFWFNIDKNN